MKVSLIQTNPGSDKARNLARVEALIAQAVLQEHPDYILLPEVFDWMGGNGPEKHAAAEAFPNGQSYGLCQSLARRHGVWIQAGSLREVIPGDPRVYNTTLVFNRQGVEVARYRKIHLFDIVTPDGTAYRESDMVHAGSDVVVFDCEGVKIGCAICYDLRFPELFQALVAKGAEVITLPSAFTQQTGQDHWEPLCRARAIETQTYFLACGQSGAFMAGKEKRFTYGHSLVVDPWGLVVARASDGENIVSARLELARVHKTRQQIPLASHKKLLMS